MARDYRSFQKYDIEDIYYNELETEDWLGKRMAFLWECREYYPRRYMGNNLNTELQVQFYGINDIEVHKHASEAYSYYKDYKLSDEDIVNEFKRLEKVKSSNAKEFLLTKNKSLYDYCTIQIDNKELHELIRR